MRNPRIENLEALVCLLDGKITMYRINGGNNKEIIEIQEKLHKIWDNITKWRQLNENRL